MTTHHDLNPYPSPRDKAPLYVNETELIDTATRAYPLDYNVLSNKDTLRIYVPLDLNKELILHRLRCLIAHYGEANEANELDFSIDVDMLVSQIEIYDQLWYVKHMPEQGSHSEEAIELVKEFVAMLEDIPDGCAELFPFETIDELKTEYLER